MVLTTSQWDKLDCQETWMTPHNQYGDVFCFCYFVGLFCCVFFNIEVLHHNRRRLGGILTLHEASKWLCGSDNVTRASVDKRVSGKWVESWLCANYPFKLRLKVINPTLTHYSISRNVYCLTSSTLKFHLKDEDATSRVHFLRHSSGSSVALPFDNRTALDV